MSANTIFTVIIALILLRVLWLRIKASSTRNDNFKNLPAKDRLAILKECLLNNPSERNLQNLGNFIHERGMNQDIESYRNFMKKQTELRSKKNALHEDNELYTQESRWMDLLEPLEFSEARNAREAGKQEDYIIKSLEGTARFYSDEAIQTALENLKQDYPKAEKLLEDYRSLMKARDESDAEDTSLEALRKKRDLWEEDLLNYQR